MTTVEAIFKMTNEGIHKTIQPIKLSILDRKVTAHKFLNSYLVDYLQNDDVAVVENTV